MKMIKIKCCECGIEFEKPLKEYKRCIRLRLRQFCSRTCSTIRRNKEISPEDRLKYCYDISQHAGNRNLDNHSIFRYFIRKIKTRNHEQIDKKECDITSEYLKTLWESQRGICPYTGLKMDIEKLAYKFSSIHSMTKASLDRIDSKKGYIKGNVEFVCLAINYAKNGNTKEEMKEFIAKIKSATTNLTSPL
jgi:hypothetical protein